MCYLYNKSSYFVKDCRLQNLINCRQINTILREILDSQNNIREQIDTETNTLETRSNNNYYLVENSNQLQKVLDRILSDKIFASIQKINQILNKTIKAQQLETLYLYSIIDLDNKYNQKNFYEYLDNITNYLDVLVSLSKEKKINQIVNKCKKALESDATIKKDILDEIEQQLSNISLSREKIEKAKKHTIFS